MISSLAILNFEFSGEDEAQVVYYAKRCLARQSVGTVTTYRHGPLRVFLLLPMVLSNSFRPWVYRLPSLLLNCLSLWPLYKLLQINLGAENVPFAFFLYTLLIGWLPIFQLTFVSGYSFFILFMLYFYILYTQNRDEKYLLYFSICCVIAMGFHEELILYFIPAFLFFRNNKGTSKNSTLSIASFLLPVLYLIIYIIWASIPIIWASAPTKIPGIKPDNIPWLTYQLKRLSLQNGMLAHLSQRLSDIGTFNFKDVLTFFISHTSVFFVGLSVLGMVFYFYNYLYKKDKTRDNFTANLGQMVFFFLPQIIVWGLVFKTVAWGHFTQVWILPYFFILYLVFHNKIYFKAVRFFTVVFFLLTFYQSVCLLYLNHPSLPALFFYDLSYKRVDYARSGPYGKYEIGQWIRANSLPEDSLITNLDGSMFLFYADRPHANDVRSAKYYVQYKGPKPLFTPKEYELIRKKVFPKAEIFEVKPRTLAN